ncbi:MAG: cytochrome C biogenesis protein ResA [Thermus sp.]|uniref:c-type cytochrome n=1 Tax=Thermus sp. TaxID=275 RepID=UPI0033261DB9
MRSLAWAFFLSLALAQTGPYQRFCVQCHGERGQGARPYPGFSALLKDRLFETPEGRRYLVQVVLYGRKTETLLMPGFAHLKDEEVAQALNQVLSLLGVKASPFTPEEVRKERERPLAPEEVKRPSPPR